MFNPGQLKDKIKILSISQNENDFTWDISTTIWAKVEQTNKRNIFSNQGYGAKLVNLVIRKRDLTLHNAIRWNQKHLFITDIIEKDRMYYEVSAALIEPITCIILRNNEPTLDELNRPVYDETLNAITLPAYMIEKYVKHTEEYPMSTVESIYILITPKVIELINGELVAIKGTDYEVLVSHTIDEYKNEYEIRARKES